MQVPPMFVTKDYGYCERSADYERKEGDVIGAFNINIEIRDIESLPIEQVKYYELFCY